MQLQDCNFVVAHTARFEITNMISCAECMGRLVAPATSQTQLNASFSHVCRKALNASPRLRHLNLTSCRGVPRGLKQWHGGAKIQSLLTTLEELESRANSEQRRSG